jgi:hypothetical protein
LQIVQRSPTAPFIGQFSRDDGGSVCPSRHVGHQALVPRFSTPIGIERIEISKPFQKKLQNRGAATPPRGSMQQDRQ